MIGDRGYCYELGIKGEDLHLAGGHGPVSEHLKELQL
jgi:hypothetical protein